MLVYGWGTFLKVCLGQILFTVLWVLLTKSVTHIERAVHPKTWVANISGLGVFLSAFSIFYCYMYSKEFMSELKLKTPGLEMLLTQIVIHYWSLCALHQEVRTWNHFTQMFEAFAFTTRRSCQQKGGPVGTHKNRCTFRSEHVTLLAHGKFLGTRDYSCMCTHTAVFYLSVHRISVYRVQHAILNTDGMAHHKIRP